MMSSHQHNPLPVSDENLRRCPVELARSTDLALELDQALSVSPPKGAVSPEQREIVVHHVRHLIAQYFAGLHLLDQYPPDDTQLENDQLRQDITFIQGQIRSDLMELVRRAGVDIDAWSNDLY